MSIITTARGAGGTNTILANRIPVDMSDVIVKLNPSVMPLTVLSKKLGTKPCSNYKFEWLESDMMARWIANTAVQIAADTTTIPLAAAGQYANVAVGDLLKVASTGEIMLVTAITGTTNITVTRAYSTSGTAAAIIPASSKILIIGNAMQQGSGAPSEKYKDVTASFNYTQIFKTPFAVTNTLDATKLYGPSELARLQADKGIEHGLSIEYAFWFGEKLLVTSGSQPVTATGGVIQSIGGSATSISVSADNTESLFEDFVQSAFEYGSTTKTMFCSPNVLTYINRLATGKMELVQANNDTTYGLTIRRYLSPHGVLNLVLNPLFKEGYKDTAVVLDMGNITYRPLAGRDTKLLTSIQSPDEDGRRDMYITEAGIEVKLPSTHKVMVLTT